MHLSLAERRKRYETGFVVLCSVFAVLMVLTNVIGTKLFAFFPGILETGFGFLSDNGPVILTTGLVTYPLTFLFTDVCAEIYGRRRANIMVSIGFGASILMLIVVQVAINVTPADRYWADASHQLTHGTEVLAVDGKEVSVDHIQFLSETAMNKPVMLGVIGGEELSFVSYHAINQSGGGFAQPYRDCVLSMHAGTVEPGQFLVPAVQLIGFERNEQFTRIQIEGGAHIPAQGTLSDGGTKLSYVREDNADWIRVNGIQQYDQAADKWNFVGLDAIDVSNSRPAALVNEMAAIDMQLAMKATFASPAILLMASMLAYLVAQFLDVYMYHFWKRVTKGKMLWLRNNGSTWVSQLVDTITVNGIFIPVAFGLGFMPTLYIIICVYLVKLMIAAIDTPLIYLAVYLEKKRLGYEWEDEVPDLLSDKAEALV